jgi:hypothetical protein
MGLVMRIQHERPYAPHQLKWILLGLETKHFGGKCKRSSVVKLLYSIYNAKNSCVRSCL